MTQLFSLILIHWIVIYPVDSAIQRLNNRGLYQRVNLIPPAMSLTQTLCGNNDLYLTKLKYCRQGLLFK